MPVTTQIILSAIAVLAAYFDLRWRTIPNWLVLTGLLSGLALNVFLFGWEGLRSSFFGIGIAMLVYLPLYALRAMGAGDAKLMMAIGSLVGPGTWLFIFFATGILGGIIGLVVIVASKRVKHTLWNVGFLLHRLANLQTPYANSELDVRSDAGLRLPHGAAVALGTIVVVCRSGSVAGWDLIR